MDENIKKQLIEKNDKIINMVIERAKRDFFDDIAIIGLTGSFSTGDFHEKSDLDLIVINNTEQGWEISSCFILEDVGYDIYCTPWNTRIEAEANLESDHISCLVDLKILYCAKSEYMDKFNKYRQRALDILNKPIGKDCLERAQRDINMAKEEYANTMLLKDIGAVRYAAGKMLHNLINALTSMNNTYIRRGIKRYLEEVSTYRYVPDGFEDSYSHIIDADTIDKIRLAAFDALERVSTLYEKMYVEFVNLPKQTYENLVGTYEELWCNCRNKVLRSVQLNDKAYAYHSAIGAQAYLDEMTETRGTKKFNVMQYFDAEKLNEFKEEFLRIMNEYLEEYNKVGRAIKMYKTFEELYEDYMRI